jgi:uncharacterized iron-regulated membrane protein
MHNARNVPAATRLCLLLARPGADAAMVTLSARAQNERYIDTQASLARVDALARLMDSAVAIPGTSIRLGLDALIGLVPVAGDVISSAISTYIVWEARRLGVSRWTVARMLANTAVDTVIGAIPVIGDAFDVAFRGNMRNLALLRAHIARNDPRGPVIEGSAVRLD